MEYRISVPVISANVERQGRERILQQLRDLDAKRVFLALDCYELSPEKRQKAMLNLKNNCDFFHQNGFEVGAWIWTFMFASPTPFTRMTMLSEELEESEVDACPLDADFLRFSGEYIQDIARCGVDLIQFDDDFRMAYKTNGHTACLCELHRKRICERLGEELSRKELAARILKAPSNPYRDAWLAENGHSFEKFAKSCRRYLDEINPNIRMGQCACVSSWDIDGTDAATLARLLAGKTRPFLRLIGAPYWAVNRFFGNTLQDVVEQERLEASWTRDGEIEIMAEGDAYPRPRSACPAAYMEGFDTAIRAAGFTDGILKYGIDYTSSAEYEKGYVERHKRNRLLYEQIDRAFGDKSACGIRVYEFSQKVACADVSEAQDPQSALTYLFFSNAARLLCAQAIPTTYEGAGVCGIAFGENAKHLTAKQRQGGLIIDGSAALFLHERGIDVGIAEAGVRVTPSVEWFEKEQELITTYGAVSAFAHRLKPSAHLLSASGKESGLSLLDSGSQADVPMSWLYENADGERYLVLNYDARFPVDSANDLFFRRQYLHGKRIADAVPWLSRGKRLPAACCGNPGLYMIAKQNDKGMSVGLWNFYPDSILDPVVELGASYRELFVFGSTDAVLEGNTVRLGEISPYGFVGLSLTL